MLSHQQVRCGVRAEPLLHLLKGRALAANGVSRVKRQQMVQFVMEW